ncbi:MAG: hypothetical protein K2X66_12210, partial [Cyanobacteria bacterium]|nr:hypothetical protein [Cyanobacteriota bacterium]
MSSFIHIKKKTVSRGDGVTELYAVPAVAISIGQGKKLIPNPAGSETCIFNTLEEAESAVKRAGFDYIFEGVKTYTTQSQYEAHLPQTPAGPSVTIEDSIPILIERLVDRETTVIANAAFALGELH